MKKAIWQGLCPEGLTLEQRFELSARAGFQGIQVGVADKATEGASIPLEISRAELAKLRQLAERTLPIIDLWCEDQWEFPITANDESTRRRTIERTKRTIEISAELGVTSNLLVAGQVNAEHSYRTVWNRSLQVLREHLLPHAQKHNVQLNIETVWNKFLLGPVEFGYYLKEVNHPLVGMHLDVCNVAAWSYPWDWIEELGRHIRQVHISGVRVDAGWSPLAWVGLLESDFDMRQRVIEPLRKIGYDGYLTIDRHHYGNYWGEQTVFLLSRELDMLLCES